MSKQSEFFDKMRPYAIEASNGTGIPVAVILAQWANESGYGQSALAQNANNFGGIKWVQSSIASGKYNAYAAYSNISQFVQDYVRVLNLSYYDKVRSAGSVAGAVRALGESPYAESHYGGHGENLQSIIDTNGLESNNNIAGMSSADLQMYAGIGVAAVALFALIAQAK